MFRFTPTHERKPLRIALILLLATACSTAHTAPEPWTITPIAEGSRLAAFAPTFDRHVDVYGVHIVATATTGERELSHAANVLAQYLDNDGDRRVDDARVHRALVDGGAFLAMASTQDEFEHLDLDFERLERDGFCIGQDLYGDETRPEGSPHVRSSGRFDASLEEVWHLVSNGWVRAYPDAFGYGPGSRLTDAMDRARGGRFASIPQPYPETAWYHYDDPTCDYECQAAEYFYWALTTLLGGQDYAGRAEQIAIEWEASTPAELRTRDPAVVTLLTDPAYRLPSVLPDGRYAATRR
ncbi:MAG: hypothetical protein AAF628_18650 [Planctomycetota bacterium]